MLTRLLQSFLNLAGIYKLIYCKLQPYQNENCEYNFVFHNENVYSSFHCLLGHHWVSTK